MTSLKLLIKMHAGFCPTTGKSFTESDLETLATKRGFYYFCNCCNERLVVQYPFVIKPLQSVTKSNQLKQVKP